MITELAGAAVSARTDDLPALRIAPEARRDDHAKTEQA